ncbi:hypothetical protein ACSMX9_17450 [Streptomyces sp. LE64]|uniref:hypothetical protein n=1 Tax=Streptomyces sp. LE64 TaxID=3448653 RepID=UPI0040427A2F
MTSVLFLASFFGVLAAIVGVLVVVLLRRPSSTTENVDGLLIEQQRRIQAYEDRQNYGPGARNRPPGLGDSHRR